jgi:hypothetical protein
MKKNSRSKSWSILNWVYKHTQTDKLVCTYTQYGYIYTMWPLGVTIITMPIYNIIVIPYYVIYYNVTVNISMCYNNPTIVNICW